ncbi:MAG: hypothetical protein IMW97_00405 [Firmicutes bacterium]|nr:hypothetical protein [Candidatus Fermentithermobacillaceae bacterium]
MKNLSLRQIYLYLVSFVALMILVAGLIQTVMAIADFFIPQAYYEPGPADIYSRYKAMGSATEIPEEVIRQQIQFEKEQAAKNILASRYSNLRRALAYVLVGLPVWLYHWKKIQYEATINT